MEKLTKQLIRQEIKSAKKLLTKEEVSQKSRQIIDRLIDTTEYKEAARIYTYVNYNTEVDTILLIQKAFDDGKIVLVPKVYEDVMKFHVLTSLEELEKGAYGILEPKSFTKTDEIHSGLMIMPGLCFDRECHRIGYGGGFYDKYLEQHQDFYKISLCYDFQIYDKIPSDEYDIKVDKVISENRVIQ